MNIVEQNINQVSKLFEQHNVGNMYLFESVLTDNFSSTSRLAPLSLSPYVLFVNSFQCTAK